jgi:hypothetical protein
MPSADDIGSRGKAILIALLAQPCGSNREPLFRPHFLGEKFATLDFLVELIGLQKRAASFFIQVKTTARGYTRTAPNRLDVRVSQRDIDRMLVFPGPTYVVGVDERNGRAYLASVNGTKMSRIAGLPTTYPLNEVNLKRLWDEVDRYWRSRDTVLENSVFTL